MFFLQNFYFKMNKNKKLIILKISLKETKNTLFALYHNKIVNKLNYEHH